MKRRTFLRITGTSAMMASLPAAAQDVRTVKRIGFLRLGVPPPPVDAEDAADGPPFFWPAMRAKGWIRDVNAKLIPRFARNTDELSTMAADLVALKVDLIMTNGTAATLAVKKATTTIPVVFWLAADPVRNGIVSNLARPEGNITGFVYGEYHEKILETIRDALPLTQRVAYPLRELSPVIQHAALALKLKAERISIAGPTDFDQFFAKAREGRFDIAVIPDDTAFNPYLGDIAALALQHRMASIGAIHFYAEAGGLMAFGPQNQHVERVPVQIDRILRGAKPADFPIEQPTRYELAVNRKTEALLGLTLSKAVLARATKVW